MKELSIEEKAKRYDEAIEKAKSKIKNDKDHVLYEDDVIEIFPELAENKDERMIKCITLLINGLIKGHFIRCGASYDEIKAWLEKQGEYTNFRNKIQIGDKVTRNEDGVLVNLSQLNRVAKKDEKQGKQKPWSEEDERMLDGIIEASTHHCYLNITDIDWLKSIKDRFTWKPSDEQIKVCKEIYADLLSAKGFDLGTVNSELNRLEEELKKLKD